MLSTQRYDLGSTISQLEGLQVATEVFLVEQLVRINYVDLMNTVPEGTSTKNRLISWANDSLDGNVVRRAGLITLYKEEHKKTFNNGVWNAVHYPQFIEFCFKKLIDPDFIENNKIREEFLHSIQNQDWFHKASRVLGLKLLEDMYVNKSLRSKVARQRMALNYQYRQSWQQIAKLIGRNWHAEDISGKDVLEHIIEEMKKQYDEHVLLLLELEDATDEYFYLRMYKKQILRLMHQTRLKVIEGSFEQLYLNFDL